jgi:hypothetical protein
MNQYDKVITKDFAKRFVNHRYIGLGPERVAEFSLHHGKSRFDVAALVIVERNSCLRGT